MSDTSEYTPLRRDAIAEQVVRMVLELIQSGQLRPGDRLPPEREFAESLGVSRPALREGLRTLAHLNVLQIRHGGRSTVASLDPASLVAHLDALLALDDGTIFELLRARQLVEPELAAAAAERMTPQELAALNACLEAMGAAEGELERLAALDVELHQRIAEAAGNVFLSRFMASLRSLGRRSRARTVQIEAIRRQSQRDHELIVAALNAHDPDLARSAMRLHLRNIEQGLRAANAE